MITERLKVRYYSHVYLFRADVMRLFNNCREVFGADSEQCKCANQLQAYFEKKMVESGFTANYSSWKKIHLIFFVNNLHFFYRCELKILVKQSNKQIKKEKNLLYFCNLFYIKHDNTNKQQISKNNTFYFRSFFFFNF